MPHIVLGDEQARLVTDSPGVVEIQDGAGRILGIVSSRTDRRFGRCAGRESDGTPVVILAASDRQARIISHWRDSVELHDGRGRVLGRVAFGFTAEEIAEAKASLKSDGPRYTTAEVMAHLEWLAATHPRASTEPSAGN